MEILLLFFIIINKFQRKECYDLVFILLAGILVENIVLYKKCRYKEDFIAAIAVFFAMIFFAILYILN